MAFFQNSVLAKHLKAQDGVAVLAAYDKYKTYFLNPEIQQNIRDLKEEQFQQKFLMELFVNILGYTINPDPQYNLTTEFKNEIGAKKADGAILQNGKALGVIELKGTDTKDLDKINQQAFNYKNNQSSCIYVITSNFEKLRFFINNSVEHIEFNLFTLTGEEFELLWFCLNSDNLVSGLPLKAKDESLLAEENITKQLYKDYASFRTLLWQNLVKNNPDADQLMLFKKTQKLLDRFLFIFFAEDSGLLPPNSISRMVERWELLRDEDAYKPLYEIFKQYFGYINIGRKGKVPQDDIFAYNGGLFFPDEVLDNIIIDDDVLQPLVIKLTNYDFQSDVDVNILGHIFENSLSEIENVTAQLSGQEVDKNKSKRKKDGVYYTPKYITKYIVDNTVGKLCEEKKTELGIVDEEYAKGRRNRKKETIKKLDNSLQKYRDWLLEITICDPACGSGAFLNQALEFLINEHTFIDELYAQLHGASIIFQDVSNHILEKNLFGVDINEESVEIAKLSLWLRTAQRGRKLTFLNNNIKCGNSLIDDPEVAGEKAFNWEMEFPVVFNDGGFDVVIGNPPYVDIKGLDVDFARALFKRFETTENRINLYSIFIEKGYSILKSGGFLSFINPNSILFNSSYSKIRKLLIDHLTTIVKLPDGVFEDAVVETILFEFRKHSNSKKVKVIAYSKDARISQIDDSFANYVLKESWKLDKTTIYNIYVCQNQLILLQNIYSNSVELGEIADFSLGLTPYDKYKGHSQELIKSRGYHSVDKRDETYKPLISGTNISRFVVTEEIKEFIKYGDWLGAPREERFFTIPRVLIRQIVSGQPPRIYAGYTEKALYYSQIGFGIIPKQNTISVKVLLGIVNSKLINFYHKYSFLDLEKELFQKILIANCKRFPIKRNLLNRDLFDFENLVTNAIEINKQIHLQTKRFISYALETTGINLTRKLEHWYNLSFNGFIREINAGLIKSTNAKLSKSEGIGWMDVFEKEKTEIFNLKNNLDRIDKEIDQLVYGLYGLTEEEIKIVEEG